MPRTARPITFRPTAIGRWAITAPIAKTAAIGAASRARISWAAAILSSGRSPNGGGGSSDDHFERKAAKPRRQARSQAQLGNEGKNQPSFFRRNRSNQILKALKVSLLRVVVV